MGSLIVSAIVTETVGILWEELHTKHMPETTVDNFKSLAADFFDTWNFPL